jgi:hypothetical protein
MQHLQLVALLATKASTAIHLPQVFQSQLNGLQWVCSQVDWADLLSVHAAAVTHNQTKRGPHRHDSASTEEKSGNSATSTGHTQT